MNKTEKPLEHLVGGYSRTSIFRTMAFVGDSLSSGEFEVKLPDGRTEFYDRYEHSWGQYLARRNGLKGYNFSRGGMQAKWYVESYAEENGFWDADKACQAYVIALGVNDILVVDTPIGSVADIDTEDYRRNGETFAGYYAQIISRYKEISPDAKFFLVGFPKETSYAAKTAQIEEFYHLLYALAEHFDNTYVIDLYQYGEEYDEAFKAAHFLNGHMNPMGYLYTAQIIDSYIDYLIRQNPQDFQYVGLINTGLPY